MTALETKRFDDFSIPLILTATSEPGGGHRLPKRVVFILKEAVMIFGSPLRFCLMSNNDSAYALC